MMIFESVRLIDARSISGKIQIQSEL